jgi:hypothetical protein
MGHGMHREYGPYGSTGDEVGSVAICFLDSHFADRARLSANPEDDPLSWSKADSSTFDHLCTLETGIKFIEPDPDVDGSDIEDLHFQFARLHAALPFSEPEREWLLAHTGREDGELPTTLVGKTAEVMSEGVLQVLQGRDLVRRWWAWRRAAFEFKDQGSLEEACLTLGGIAETLVMGHNRPREWPRIQAQLEQLRPDGA